MIRKKSVRAFIAAMAVAAAGVVVAGPASAAEAWVKDITCTSSTGYSINLTTSIKGVTLHEVPGSFYKKYAGSTSYVSRHSNTHVAGHHDAWAYAINYSGVSGKISSYTAYCSTY